MKISSPEFSPSTWSLLLSQIQDFLESHLARVPVTPNQQGTYEKGDEVFSSVGAHDTDKIAFHESDLDYVDFYWENGQMDLDAVFRPGIDTSF